MSYHCGRCLRRRKEKGGDAEDVELGVRGAQQKFDLDLSPATQQTPLAANSQDADEMGANSAQAVPEWQMPQLVIACPKRPGARIHKGTSVTLPDAGGDLVGGIVANLPVLLQIRPTWHLGYSMAVDGVSLRTMYRQVADVGPCLLIVEDSSNCIFGAFLSEGLRPGNQCYGTHECFIFRFPRASGAWRTEVYSRVAPTQAPVQAAAAAVQVETQGAHWANYLEALRKCQAWAGTTSNSAGVFCDHTGIVVGIDGPALFIDQNLLRGVSWPSAAFGSPCLAAAGPDFVVRNLEVWHWAEH